jgi:SpoVK/Ycf46/Vps4 family AAA+-type ATPase
MLRRLEKRVLVDLPSKEARICMFRQFLPPTVIQEPDGLVLYSDLDYERLSDVCSILKLEKVCFLNILGYRRILRCGY